MLENDLPFDRQAATSILADACDGADDGEGREACGNFGKSVHMVVGVLAAFNKCATCIARHVRACCT